MMIIKSNPVTEEVSAVDGHQLYKLITPQGEKKETQMGHLVSGYRVVLLCRFMVQKSHYKCPPSMFICEKPGLVRSTSWWSTTQQSMQLVIEMSHSRLYCRDFGDFVCKSTRVKGRIPQIQPWRGTVLQSLVSSLIKNT